MPAKTRAELLTPLVPGGCVDYTYFIDLLDSVDVKLSDVTLLRDYDATKTYAVGEPAFDPATGKLYRAIISVPVSTPPPNIAYWETVDRDIDYPVKTIEVADIASPTELNALNASNGLFYIAYQVGTQFATLYKFDAIYSTGAVPYVVPALTAGHWIAIGGNYVINQNVYDLVINNTISLPPSEQVRVKPLVVVDIDDPSAELNLLDDTDADVYICYEVDAVGASSTTTQGTVYRWNSNQYSDENVPYVVDGTSGSWVAVSGKYQLTTTINNITVEDITINNSTGGAGAPPSVSFATGMGTVTDPGGASGTITLGAAGANDGKIYVIPNGSTTLTPAGTLQLPTSSLPIVGDELEIWLPATGATGHVAASILSGSVGTNISLNNGFSGVLTCNFNQIPGWNSPSNRVLKVKRVTTGANTYWYPYFSL